ncbi:MAG: M13 family metallopeptidase [Steroidobacteraceae bacterium]
MNKRLLLIAGLISLASAAGADPHGIQPGDINRDGNACNDFFDYANGTWRKENAIPDYMDRWSRRWQSGEVNKEHVRSILEEVSARRDWPVGSAEQLSGDFYGACMNEDRINEAGIAPVQTLLDEIRAIKTRADVQRLIGRLHAIGVDVAFAISANQDLHDPAQVIAHVFASGLGLPDRDYYLKLEDRFVEARAKYHEHLARMFVLAGSTPEAAATAATSVFELERRFAEATLDNVARRDPYQRDHKTPFDGLAGMAPDFDWGGYFDAARLPRIDLNVTEPKFLQAFNQVFAKAPIEQWRNYLAWHVLDAFADSLSAPLVEQSFAFYGRFLSGATEMKPRWKRCAEATDEQLGEALGRAYVEKHFSPGAKARMEEMVRNIQLAMRDTIEGLDWMSPATKVKAQEKLATFKAKVGYPDKWKDYAGVTIGRDSYFADVIATTRWNINDDLSQIGKPVDRSRWAMTPPTSNAYYSAAKNEIVFPAGILQPPAFDVTATDAVNYGAIGVVIGHEVSHGFDDQGAKFDAQGRLKNWWTAADNEQFKARGQCVVKQFDGYFIEPGIHHNGNLVLGESIGDLAGAKLAYLAYQKSRGGKGPEPTIDGFTPEQQFFLSWGQWRGDEIRPETQRTMIQSDPHPIAKFRVNGPLSNLPEFSKAFSCKAGDTMVRPKADRCEVW